MKSILKTINVSSISSFALIGMLSILVTGCGSDAGQSDPRRFDTPLYVNDDRDEGLIHHAGPEMVLIGEETIELDINGEYVELGAVARDIWDVRNLADQDTQTNEVNPVLIEGSVDNTQPGTYTISYTATDTSNNSNTITRAVIVADRAPPVITISGDNPVLAVSGDAFVPPSATYYDLFDDAADTSAVTAISSDNITSNVDTSTPGNYTVTYTASDASGNEATKNLTVIVEPDYQDEIVLFITQLIMLLQ